MIALSLTAQQRAGSLKRVLTTLAANTRAELEMRRKVELERRALRRQAQRIAGAVAGFAALVTVAVTIISGARLPSWYWIGLTAGTALGTVFVHWLIFQSVHRIGALCPYCMVVWVVTGAAFVAVLARWSRAGALPRWVGDYAVTIVTTWCLVVAALIAVRFWDYWITLA